VSDGPGSRAMVSSGRRREGRCRCGSSARCLDDSWPTPAARLGLDLPERRYWAGGAVPLLGERSAMTPPAMIRRIPTASSTLCFQPHPGSPIPSGLANAAISAATTPTRTTTIPVCLLDMRRGDYLAEGRGGKLRSQCDLADRSKKWKRPVLPARAASWRAGRGAISTSSHPSRPVREVPKTVDNKFLTQKCG
jgi:hypothetical protein